MNKDRAYTVLMSCKTRAQLVSARNYLFLSMKADWNECKESREDVQDVVAWYELLLEHWRWKNERLS